MKKQILIALSVIIILTAFYTNIGNASTQTASFGTTIIGSLSTTLNTAIPRATQYTPSSSGTVTDIMLYLTGSGHAQTAIYTDNGNAPGTLIAKSTSDTITSNGWHDFKGFNVAITAGTSYWLACESDSGNLQWYYNNGGANYYQGSSGSYGTFPDPYAKGSFGNYQTSIYAIYTTANLASFGTTIIGSLSTTLNTAIPRATQYTPSSSGTVTDIMLYLTGSGHAQTAIYTDNGNAPGTLIAKSTSDTITSNGWHDFKGFNVAITAGTSYWLACESDSGNLQWYYNNGGANYYQGSSGSYGTFPDPYAKGSFGNYQTSIYAIYTTANLASFGTTIIGSLSTTLNTAIPRATQYTPSSSGTVTDIMLYLTGSGHAQTAIYTDNGNAPGTLIAKSTSDTITSNGWHDFKGFNVAITAGTSYWLACESDSGNLQWYYNNGGANYYQGSSGSYGTFPDPYAKGSFGNYQTSIYAIYTSTSYSSPPSTLSPTSTPTPTPSPTPTPTPSPTPTPTPSPTPTPTPSPTPTPTPSPTPTPTPAPAPPTGTYSYTMDISGSNYRILNSAKSVIYQSTSSSTAFNWLLGSGRYASSGSSVYVGSGAYLIDHTWNINVNDVTVTFASTLPTTPNIMGNLVGSGTPGAVLTAIAGLNNYVLSVSANNVVIIGVTINGNSANQIHGGDTKPWNFQDNFLLGGIYLHGQNGLVEYSTIYNCRQWGVSVEASNSGMRNSIIHDVGWNGFTTYQYVSEIIDNVFCINSEVYRCGDVGLDSQSQNTIFTGNYVHDICPNSPLNGIIQPQGSVNSYWGIAWENCGYGNCGGTGGGTYALCTGNVLNNCYNTGVIVSAEGTISYVSVSKNTLTNCDSGSGGYYGAIEIAGSRCRVEFNSLNSCLVGIGIGKGGGSPIANNVYGNTYSGCTTNYVNYGSGTTAMQPS